MGFFGGCREWGYGGNVPADARFMSIESKAARYREDTDLGIWIPGGSLSSYCPVLIVE